MESFYLGTLPYFCQNFFPMLQGKVIVITGGTDGIGKALVEKCLQQEAHVATCGRNEEKLALLKSEFPGKDILALQCDVSREEDCKTFIDKVLSYFGRIDILINNAGISMRSLFKDVNLEAMKQVMDINFWGSVYCTKYALESITRHKGTIVGISSVAGHRGLPGRGGYSASKFALNGWLESLRGELLDTGVNVMWVAPGFTQTNVRKVALTKDLKAQGKSPLNESKLMSADECAALILTAISKRKRSVVLTFQGKQTVFMNKFFPSLTDKLVRKFFFKDGNLIK